MNNKVLLIVLCALFFSLAGVAQELYVPTPKGATASVPRAVIMGNNTSGKALLFINETKLTTETHGYGNYAISEIDTSYIKF